MIQDNLIKLRTPQSGENYSDSLTELVHQGARQIITQAVEAELTEFLGQYQELKTESGHQGVVRNGYLPERTITTGVGAVLVQVPKVRDRNRRRRYSLRCNLIAAIYNYELSLAA